MHGPGASRQRLLALIAMLWCLLLPQSVRAQAETESGPGPEQRANPLSKFFNRVLGGGPASNPDGNPSPEAPAEPGDGMTRRLAASSLEARRLAQAELAIAAEDWHDAVESLQWVLDQPQDLIVPLEGGLGRTVQAEAEARIGRLPPAGLQVYETEYGRIAAQLLEQARGPDALRDAAIVANRFFHTVAGKLATAKVASLLFDRGEYAAASAWYSRLVGDPTFQNSVDWRARASYALVQSGDRASAQPLLDSLQKLPAPTLVPRSGPHDDLAAWILKHPADATSTPQLDDWLTLYGTAAHVGVAPPVDPLLLQRWSHPLTSRYRLDQQIRDLLLDLSDNHRAAIPAGIPIVVGGRAAFRTLRGLAVVDAHSGQLLWENDPELTAEGLLTNETQPEVNPYSRFRGFAMDYGGNVDQSPLTTQLFRDAAYGLLSSDGRRLFSIENSVLMPPPSFNSFWPSNNPANQDPYQRDWSSNQIHAYDLATGERLWETGGRRMDEPFDPPLAGVFFFGPPVADGDELFAIGEQDEQLHLFALAPETGVPLWSQTIGDVEATIDRDVERRHWAAAACVEGGLVICPTTTGWLVAVDRHTHRIAWAHRFSETPASRGPTGVATIYSQQILNERWCAAAPIVSGGNVFYAPPEQPDPSGQVQPELICLDARTGARRWGRPKGTSLYLAGVFDGRPLVVGRDDIRLLGIDDGLPVWTTPIPAEVGPPSGRGLAVGGRFLLPLQSGQLWTIDLQDGKVVDRTRLPGSQPAPLGNLAVWKGMLISLGPFGLAGFEQRVALQQAIAARLATNPRDVWAAVKQAEIDRIAGNHAAALLALEQSQPAPTDDHSLLEQRRILMFDTLIASLKERPDAPPAEFDLAASLAAAPTERLELERLLVDREIADGQWDSAFRRCRKIADEFAMDQMVADGATSLRLDVWLGGRLADVMAQAPAELAESFAEEIASLLESSAIAPPAALSLERMYGFHPAAHGFVWRLIEEAAFRRDFAGAELRLRRLIDDGDRTTAAAALARLGDLMVEFGQPVEAAVVYARLSEEFGDVLLPSLKTGAETARERFASGAVALADLQPPSPPRWSPGAYRISHYRVVNSEYAMPQLPLTRQFRGPFFERHAFEFDTQSPFLTVLNRSDNSVFWRLPLRTGDAQGYQQTAVVFGHGLQAVIWHSGMLHALSLPDRRVLWSRPASDRDARFYPRGAYDNSASAALIASGSFAARIGLASSQSLTSMLAVANSRYVACHSRGEFLVLDALTGEVLWRQSGIERDTKLLGDARTLCVIPDHSSVSKAHAVRAVDGRPVDIQDLQTVLKSTIAVNSSGWIRAERHSGARTANTPPKFRIFAFDPLARRNNWSHEFSGRSSVTFVDDSHLFVLDEASGDCSLLNVENGSLAQLGSAPSGSVSQSTERYAVADARQVYVVMNDSRNNFSNYVHPPAVRTSGTVLAFARDGSGLAWRQTVENQNLLLPGLDQSPLLVFLAYDHVHLPDIEADYEKSRIVVLDKSDGRVLIEEVRATPNGNYYRIDVNPDDRAVDIYSHNERVRIEAVPPDAPDDNS